MSETKALLSSLIVIVATAAILRMAASILVTLLPVSDGMAPSPPHGFDRPVLDSGLISMEESAPSDAVCSYLAGLERYYSKRYQEVSAIGYHLTMNTKLKAEDKLQAREILKLKLDGVGKRLYIVRILHGSKCVLTI